MTFTNEQLLKARTAKSPEELLEMAKAENIEMTGEEAKKLFARLNDQPKGEISDDELDNVAGGCSTTAPQDPACPLCNTVGRLVERQFEAKYWCSNCNYSYSENMSKETARSLAATPPSES